MTRYASVDPHQPDSEALDEAARVLRDGGIVGFPTETVYGLGVAADMPEALERLRAVKNRPADKPFTYLLPDSSIVELLADEIPSRAQALMNRYWPGPLTLILPAGEGKKTVGVRVPANRIALELLRRAEVLVAAPSANPSGEPPSTSADEVRRYFDGKIELIIDGGPVTLKEPSTVVRIDDQGCSVLREGIITSEMVHQLVSGRMILFVCTGNTCRSPMAEAFFRKYLAEKLGKDVDELPELGYRIASAGISALRGSRASEGAVETMKARGIDLRRHISQPLYPELLREADRIYVMTPSHVDAVLRVDPTVRSRVKLLAEDAITDPVGGDDETYRLCADEIEAAVRRVVEGL